MKKMISHHSFNIELACLIGIEKAILLQNIFFWIDYNTKKEVSFFEGKYWTYNSAKEYQKHFPYLNANTIQRYLKQLENENWLISGNFNSNPYDRTKWFALGEKSIEFINYKCIIQNDLSIRQNDECKTQTDECISQNNECITDIIQINKQIVSKEKKVSKEHLFCDSIYHENYDLFLEHAKQAIIDYPNINIKHYYDQIADYEIKGGYKKSDWMKVLRTWIRNSIANRGDYVKLKNQTSQSEQKSFLDIDWNEFYTIIKAKNTKSLCAKYGITDKHQYVEMAQKLKEKRQVKDENGEFIYPDGQRFYVWQVYGNMLSDFQYSE